MQACKRSTPVFYRTVQRRINLGTLTSSYHPYSFRFTPTPFFSHCSFACSFSSRSNNKGQQGDGLKRSLMNGEILKVLTPQDEVRVIGPDGPIGIIPLHEALQKANEEELDLVLVDQKQDPPTCVIKNSHKEALEQKRRLREKKAATGNFKVKIKTLKLRPSIDPHDFNSKMKQAKKFLTQGHTLKMQVMLRRGMMPEQGECPLSHPTLTSWIYISDIPYIYFDTCRLNHI